MNMQKMFTIVSILKKKHIVTANIKWSSHMYASPFN